MIEALMAVAMLSQEPVTWLPDEWQMDCIGEQASGFAWDGQEWNPTNFAPSVYILTVQAENDCQLDRAGPEVPSGDTAMGFKSICVSARIVGQPYQPGQASQCLEFHDNVDGTGWQTTIVCREMTLTGYFKINGAFHLAQMAPLKPSKSIVPQDRMGIEIGTCQLTG